jgi:hypothetical protein
MLIAVPAVLVGELLIETRFRAVVEHIHQASLLDASDLTEVVATLVRVRDFFFA